MEELLVSSAKMNWTKPQLIVLTRGTPEENVLAHCKTMNPNQAVQGSRDLIQQDTCASGVEGNCRNCQARAVTGT
jgi:hypothetical protein